MKGEKMYCRIKTLTENNPIRECTDRLEISPVTVHKYAQMDMEEALEYFTNRHRKSQFRYSFDDEKIACIIEDAAINVLEKGFHTHDLNHEMEDMIKGTDEMGDLILKEILGKIEIGE